MLFNLLHAILTVSPYLHSELCYLGISWIQKKKPLSAQSRFIKFHSKEHSLLSKSLHCTAQSVYYAGNSGKRWTQFPQTEIAENVWPTSELLCHSNVYRGLLIILNKKYTVNIWNCNDLMRREPFVQIYIHANLLFCKLTVLCNKLCIQTVLFVLCYTVAEPTYLKCAVSVISQVTNVCDLSWRKRGLRNSAKASEQCSNEFFINSRASFSIYAIPTCSYALKLQIGVAWTGRAGSCIFNTDSYIWNISAQYIWIDFAFQKSQDWLKMYQKSIGGRAPPGPAGELTALPRPHSSLAGFKWELDFFYNFS
jgi:hypothetical protein